MVVAEAASVIEVAEEAVVEVLVVVVVSIHTYDIYIIQNLIC